MCVFFASLTTIIKRQVESFMSDSTSASTMPSPTPPTLRAANRRSDALNIKASVEKKLSDGDVSGVVRVLCSDATLAPVNAVTLEALNERHPPPPHDLQMPPPPDNSPEPISVSTTTIEESIRAFKPGSASGPYKLSPQHIKELISRQTGAAGSCLLQALTTMANVILSGDVPSQVCPIFFGANLIALRKPDGGVRPIAIGNTLRCMVAKAVSRLMFDTFGNKLRPVQLGCGTKAGCEAAVNAARTYLKNASESKPRILLKMDFRNAFNTLRRDKLLL